MAITTAQQSTHPLLQAWLLWLGREIFTASSLGASCCASLLELSIPSNSAANYRKVEDVAHGAGLPRVYKRGVRIGRNKLPTSETPMFAAFLADITRDGRTNRPVSTVFLHARQGGGRALGPFVWRAIHAEERTRCTSSPQALSPGRDFWAQKGHLFNETAAIHLTLLNITFD